ncbi:MG2 domain-containing protein [Myxococcota bacterium]|nr:MG2 domain-containing protein [Myxococcota bacterium]
MQSSLSARGEQPRQLCHIFTERPVYRPDEAVHVKGWFRRRHLGELEILAPKDGEYQIVLQGPGDLSWRVPATFTSAGGFYTKFAEKDLPTGTYSARLESKNLERQGCEVSFLLESYRLPTFEARIHGPDEVPLDREFELRLTATYYAGGPVADRPVRWRVTQFPFDWQPPKPLPGFFYSTDSRFSRNPELRSTPNNGEEHTTSEDGAATLSLNPALEPTAQPRSYVVEATVTGDDETTVTATKRTNALPPFVLGLSVPRFLERAKEIAPKIAVFDPKGELTAGREVVVRLVHRTWHSHLQASDFSDGVAKYVTDVVDEKLLEKKVTSQATPLTVTLPITEAGVYVVEVEARDRLGRAQVVAVDLYAGGEQPVAWEKPESHVFTVSTDKAAYDPGETAKFVLQSPFQTAKVLAVVEEPGVNRYEWLDVTGGKGVFEYLVKKNQVPRLPVHFVLMRGRVASAGPRKGAMDLGKPATMAATSWITVNPTENRVEVSMKHPERARPGEKIDVELELTTPGNKPLAGEVTLWLVDQAVLALGEEQPLDPLDRFITPVNSYLAVRDTRNSVFGELPFAENPGGDGAEAERSEEEALLDRTTVRKNFASVPYFNPAILVGPSGKVKVTIQLPDNLTIFKLRAKAASGPDRFGYATGALAVRLPVLVQPVLPRFARAGDELLGGGLARMVEGEPGPGHSELRLKGATTKAPLKQVITFDRSKPTRIEVPIAVPQPALDERGRPKGANIDVTLGAERTSDKARDAFQLTIPVLPDRRLEKTRLLADLEPGKPLVIPALSDAARPGTLVRTLLVSDEPALVKMAAGLDFLIDYPHGTTEARISKARAFLALKDFRAALQTGTDDAKLKRAVEETLKWIPSVVDTRGLVAYWPGTDGYVSLTAWTVEFLVEAKRGGFNVDDRLLRTLLATLEAALRSDYSRFIDGESWAERVFALEALAHAKRFDAAYAAELARKTDYLNLESIAGVVQAFAASGDHTSSTVKGLEPVLVGGLVFRLHQGREIYGGLQDRNLGARSGLILPSETRTIAEVTRALAELSPDHARMPLLVDALVTLGQGDGWGSTNANASALLALSARIKPKTARRDAGVRTIEVKTGGKTKTLTLGPSAPLAFTSLDGAGAIEVSATGGGKLVVRAETSWVPAKEGSTAPAISKGFVVTREQRAVDADGGPMEKLELSTPAQTVTRAIGDVVEEHVRVVNPVDRTHVAVIVPLAAGMEVLNPSLATSPPEAKPSAANTRKATYDRFLDDQVAFHFDTLPKGTYDFYFRTRAMTAGAQTQPGATAELLYDGTVFGASPGAKLVITRAEE